MKKAMFGVICAALLIGGIALIAPNANAANATPAKTGATIDAQIDALLAMPAAQRRDALKSLDRAERAGLWMRLKRAQVEKNAKTAVVPYSGMSGFPVPASPWNAPRSTGTIAYDSGFPTIGFGGGSLVGNRFNTHTGIPVLASGTVSTVQALVVPGAANTTSSAGFVLEGPQTSMGGALQVFSTFGTATGVIDSMTFSGMGANYTGSSFFVLFGDFASVYIPVFGTGTTLGQGHHGVVGYTGGMGPDITGTFDFGGALNSYVRATGNIVPVELMKYDVE